MLDSNLLMVNRFTIVKHERILTAMTTTAPCTKGLLKFTKPGVM